MSRRAAIHDRAFDRGEFHSQLAKWRTSVAASKGQPICRPNRLADYWWHVESGLVRQVRLQSSGLRCIYDFFLPHEWFVFDGISEDMVIEAVCDGTVLGRYGRFDLERLAVEDVAIAQLLHDGRNRQIARAEEHIYNLWHQRSVEKVRVFLDQMRARLPARSDGFTPLPISRYDMADYLGLSVETVSRALSNLRSRRVVEFDGVRTLKIAHGLDDHFPFSAPPLARVARGLPSKR